ncbi:MAG: SCO1664 family protein [Anaerolineales bacterium]|jgi:uncharacterized repeat protein (TIGR03843 family)
MEPDSAYSNIIQHLQNGELYVTGQFMWGSNYTFLCDVSFEGEIIQGVYKPVRGERPLWDFPSETLSGREVAAFLLSEAGGWHMVPPTVFRKEGPAGPGSLQLYIEHDPEYHFFEFSPEDKARTRAVALFDVVLNNTDRKGGHVIIDHDGKIWLIDHGVCFHVDPKLRTVIWDFAEMPLTPAEQTQLERLQQRLEPDSELTHKLQHYLTQREIQAIAGRIEKTLKAGKFPSPSENRHSIPWPPV